MEIKLFCSPWTVHMVELARGWYFINRATRSIFLKQSLIFAYFDGKTPPESKLNSNWKIDLNWVPNNYFIFSSRSLVAKMHMCLTIEDSIKMVVGINESCITVFPKGQYSQSKI